MNEYSWKSSRRLLMWAQRIKKGFHRIGLALAAIAVVAGGSVLLFGAFQWIEPLVNVAEHEVSAPDGKRLRIRYGSDAHAIGVKVKEFWSNESDRLKALELIDQEFKRVEFQREYGANLMLGSLLSLLVAAGFYLVCRTIGWILAGFLGD